MKKPLLVLSIVVTLLSCSKEEITTTEQETEQEIDTETEQEIDTETEEINTIIGQTYTRTTGQICQPLTFCQSSYPLNFTADNVSILSLDIMRRYPYTIENKTITIVITEAYTRTLTISDDYTKLHEGDLIFDIQRKNQ